LQASISSKCPFTCSIGSRFYWHKQTKLSFPKTDFVSRNECSAIPRTTQQTSSICIQSQKGVEVEDYNSISKPIYRTRKPFQTDFQVLSEVRPIDPEPFYFFGRELLREYWQSTQKFGTKLCESKGLWTFQAKVRLEFLSDFREWDLVWLESRGRGVGLVFGVFGLEP
jgi:hypothetical protein